MAAGSPSVGRALPVSPREPFLAARRSGRSSELFGPVPRDDPELRDLARACRPDPVRRRRVLELLLRAWRDQPLPAASRAAAAQLARDPTTAIVIAGQQPALAGGPLHLLAKALSATALARRLETLGIPAVALFWIADDDHDVSELAAGAVPRGDGSLWTPELPVAAGRMPIAGLELPSVPAALLADLDRELAGVGAAAQMLERLGRTVDARPGVWFRNWLLEIAGDQGLLPLTPALLRSAMVPALERELGNPGALARDVESVNGRLRSAGLPVLIEKSSELPFFLHDDAGLRHRVDPDPAGVRLRDEARTRITRDTLRAWLEDGAHRFSPDALLRPLVQDELLEPVAVIVGPSELGYLLQLADAYGARDIPRPLLIPRLQVRILDRALAAQLCEAGVNLGDIDPAQHPEDRIVAPQALALIEDLEARSAELLRFMADLDSPEYSRPLRKRAARARTGLEGSLEKMRGAIRREVIGGAESTRECLDRAWQQLWPGGQPAERALSSLWFLARYGPDLVDTLGAAFDPHDERARFLELEPLAAVRAADAH